MSTKKPAGKNPKIAATALLVASTQRSHLTLAANQREAAARRFNSTPEERARQTSTPGAQAAAILASLQRSHEESGALTAGAQMALDWALGSDRGLYEVIHDAAKLLRTATDAAGNYAKYSTAAAQALDVETLTPELQLLEQIECLRAMDAEAAFAIGLAAGLRLAGVGR